MMTPGFTHRGFMLDVSRHYMSPEEIRKLLDAAAILNLNRMHWHLTDDQGWRIEIRKYPKLTEIGSVRGDSLFGGTPEGARNSGFYTHEEIRGIVACAKGLGIEIIPEIEIPGHAAAMLAAYPEYGCRKQDGDRRTEQVERAGGIFDALVCGGSAKAFGFLTDILDEVTELFPFPAVHIGGDEALKLRWRRCPDCRRRMKELGLASEDALQRELVLQVGAYLAGKGRRTIVWNDVLAGGTLPEHFVVQQWMGGEEQTRAFMEAGGQVIRSDNRHFYMDYGYGMINVRTIWETPRIPDYAKGLERQLLGVECPLWTERVASLERAAYQLFPRLAAASCRMFEEERGWESFYRRVRELETEIGAKTGLHGAPEKLWAPSAGEAEAQRKAEAERIRIPEPPAFVEKGVKLALLEEAERLAEKIGIPREAFLRGGDAVIAEYEERPAPANSRGEYEMIRRLESAAEKRKWGEWKEMPEEAWMEKMRKEFLNS